MNLEDMNLEELYALRERVDKMISELIDKTFARRCD